MRATARPANRDGIHGWLIVDKPAGWTSHQVVGRVRRLLGERHIGHAGTLDPAATGVLPLAVGHATKVLEFLADASKTYLAEITFGVETDSLDADGRLVRVADASGLREASIRGALAEFRGPLLQIPPMHSAIKIGGRKLYELARRGEEVDRPARSVTIDALELLSWQPPTAEVLIDCSKGTYVRSLARDIGQRLGTGAYLSNLVRVRTGPFDLADAWTLIELESADLREEWPTMAYHPDWAVAARPAVLLDRETAARWANGVGFPGRGGDGLARVYGPEGDWLGIARWTAEEAAWRPAKVIASAA